jgi:predicted regulator of amino acid metabolism with ACT domain
MWGKIRHYFEKFPAQARVAQRMLSYGFRVKGDRVYCGAVAVAETALGRAVGVDRRVVSATIRTIRMYPELSRIFRHLWPVAHLREVAPMMGWGAIEIVPNDARAPGILAGVSSIIARASISIRQVIIDDPEVVDEPRGFIITDAPVPSELLPAMKAVDGVQGVVLY